MPVIIVGGEDNPIISREVCYLLEKIMMSGGFNIDDDEIRVGDRVVVTEEQNFKGKEIGQKGTAMSENIINGKKYFLICFDLRFSPDLVYHAEIRKYNCWLFEPKQLKKIKKERWIS